MKKLKSILLIDDNESDNFFHTRVINKVGCAEKVDAALNGMEALQYLTTKKDGEYPCPDLILLDINMPAMNGWEFLEEYEKLEINQKGKVIVVMLTNSVSLEEEVEATIKPVVKEFMRKPLKEEDLIDLIDKNFK